MKDTFLIKTLFFLAVLCSGHLMADDGQIEYKIKTGYLYNFTKFIVWPKIEGDTFNLCFSADDSFSNIIQTIEKKSAFDRPIKLFRIVNGAALSTLPPKTKCQILYLNGGNSKKLFLNQPSYRQLNMGLLTIGDGDDFASAGGTIGFVRRNGNIKLQINQQAARENGLLIDSKLLEIAEPYQGMDR